ncbi:Multicopper oxidase type 2 [Penicillium sp. IBT 18751x]|nr:Multicopper oxidase type 2 [Penicillium sp. IBT 18751x]
MVKLDKPYKDYTIRVPDTQGDQPFVDWGGRSTPAAVKGIGPEEHEGLPSGHSTKTRRPAG